ncbi:MAG: glycosyltransferase [Anaerolineae bacterium]|nr:glycosyltransferase [Anaerolineae bacterium]
MSTVLHVITGLSTGGAEMMLRKLVGAMDRQRFRPVVVSLMDKGTLGERIEALDVPVHALGARRDLSALAVVRALGRLVDEVKPDLVQSWMYHANLFASLAVMTSRTRVPVLWNIRASLDGLANEKRSTSVVIRVGAWASRAPSGIVYNASVSARQHEALGYLASRTEVIPNGFDCVEFRPDRRAGPVLRDELGLAGGDVLVGCVARYHPMKDHANLLAAAAQAARIDARLHFVLIGSGVEPANAELASAIARHGLGTRVHCLGERRDIPMLTAGLDIACSASAWGEGFPNIVGEAMACGVPCVVTDTGDSASIVGEIGEVVAVRDSSALARAILRLAGMDPARRAALGAAARARIVTEFSLEAVARRYEAYYRRFLRQDH